MIWRRRGGKAGQTSAGQDVTFAVATAVTVISTGSPKTKAYVDLRGGGEGVTPLRFTEPGSRTPPLDSFANRGGWGVGQPRPPLMKPIVLPSRSVHDLTPHHSIFMQAQQHQSKSRPVDLSKAA